MGRSRVGAGAIAIVMLVVVGAAGCAEPVRLPVRRLAVDETVNQVIVPGVERAMQTAWRFADALATWCDRPGPVTRRRAAAALDDATTAWWAATAYSIGPAIERRSAEKVEPALARLGELLAADASEATEREVADVRCPEALDAASVVEDHTAALERAWNAGPANGLPFRSTAAGIGDDALPNEEAIAAIRDLQLDVVGTDRAVAEGWSAAAPVDPAGWLRATRTRLGGITAVVDVLADLAGPATARRQRAAAAEAIAAARAVDPHTGAGVAELAGALSDLEMALTER